MKALAKTASGPGHVEVVDRPLRELRVGDVVVQVHGTGVCGSDLHIEDNEFPSDPPMTMGHEIAGVVIEMGEAVDPAWLGRRVVVETFYSTCGTCDWCRDGRPNLCPDRRSIGIHEDGGFAPAVVVPAANLHTIPDGIGIRAAVLAEPLACVCNSLMDPAVVQAGDRVLVTGPGPVGLLAAQLAKAMGGEVVVSGLPKDAERLAAASALGLETTSDALVAESADVVIDCSGSGSGATACLRSARRGGRYVQIGLFGKDPVIPFDLVVYRELVVTSGFASTPKSWRRAMAVMASGVVQLDPLVTRVEPLEAWRDVFGDMREGRGLKPVLDPRL